MPRLVKGPDGKIHSFPDDATDAEISDALTAMSGAPAGPNVKDFIQNGPGWRDYAREASEGLPIVGATIGGIVGSAAGPWGSVGGAGLGSMAGRSLRNTAHAALGEKDVPNTLKAVAIDQVNAGAYGAAADMGGQAIVRGLVALPEVGASLATRIVKPNKVALKKVVNESFGSTIADKERNVTKALLDEHKLTMGRRGPEELNAEIRALQSQVEQRLADRAGQPVSMRPVIEAGEAAAGAEGNAISHGGDVQSARNVVQNFRAEEGLNPQPGWGLTAGAPPNPTLPIERVNTIREATWPKLRNKVFGREVSDAETNTIHNMNSAMAAAEREAAPEIGRMLDAEGRRIGMSHVLDEARWRWGRNNALPLDVAAAAASGGKLAAAASLGKPIVGLPVAKGLYYGGNALNSPALAPAINEQTIRSILMQLLDGGEQ